MLARHNLLSILTKEKLMKKPANMVTSEFPGGLEMCFRKGWVLHGNRLSILYAGTPALKTDFTLLGKRTVEGIISDGRNGLTRYVDISNLIKDISLTTLLTMKHKILTILCWEK
jgi:hypothetical protein